MAWIIVAVIVVLVLGVVIYAVWQRRIIFTSGSRFDRGRSRTVEIMDSRHHSATVGPDGETKSLDELPPDARAKVEEMLESGRNESERIVIEMNGQRREYSSIDKVPPELRSRFESVKKSADSGRGAHRHIIIKKDGKTYTYNSIDEVPLEFRIFLKRK